VVIVTWDGVGYFDRKNDKVFKGLKPKEELNEPTTVLLQKMQMIHKTLHEIGADLISIYDIKPSVLLSLLAL